MGTSNKRDNLMDEIKKGGKEPPCPFCKVPRVKRSTYIRGCGCGVNWDGDEPLDQDPRRLRREKLLEELRAASISKPKREE